MDKLICILILSSITQVFSQITCSNPLTAKFEFTGPTTATVVPNMKYCKSLQNVPNCCSADIFDAIQTKTNTLLKTIRDAVIARDVVLTEIRLNVLPPLVSIIQRLKTATNKITTQPSSTLGSSATNLASVIDDFSDIIGILNNLYQLKSIYMEYQKARTPCIIQMVKVQAAAWCLGCDASYSTKGLTSSGVLTISSNVCNRLRNACFDYFSRTEAQSTLIQLNLISPLLEEITLSLEKVANGDVNGITEFYRTIARMTSLRGPSTNAEKPTEIPASCQKDSCSFICNDLFKQGIVDVDLLSNGGQFSFLSMSRLLGEGALEEDSSTARVLQTSTWDFDNDEAGVSVTFEDDPGKTNMGPNLILNISIYILTTSFFFIM